MKFTTASLSSQHGRKENQDFTGYTVMDGTGCWVLADGLGGHFGGEVAARIAVEYFLDVFGQRVEVSPQGLQHLLSGAQEALLRRQREQPALASMRTTLVALLADAQGAVWAHVGDSRLYRFRQGRLVFQTKDHSVPQALVNAGEITPEAMRGHPDRNRLLRVLGQAGDLRPTITPEKQAFQLDEAFLLSTDGFWEFVLETEMEADLQTSDNPKLWLQKMESRLVQRAQNMGAKQPDNYSAITVFMGQAAAK